MKPWHTKLTTLALLVSIAALNTACTADSGPAHTAPAAAGGKALKDSPAGRVVSAWFDALNSGSEQAMNQVIKDHFTDDVPPPQRLENWRGVIEESGTLTPLRVLSETPREIVVLAREKQGSLAEVGFRLSGSEPRVMGIRIEPSHESAAAGPADTSPLTEAQVITRITHLADSLAQADRFSGVVRIEHGGRVAMERAWGESDRERHVANRVDTKFNLGSINKNFTRALIAKLAEQGKLSEGDKLSKYLPDFPRDKGDRITIQQLLDMRSGLGDFFNARYDAMDKSKLRNQRDWFPLFVSDPLLYEPGQGQEYSNAGYCVLGAIAEAATGRNYYDLVRELIYQPAGMSSTDSYFQDENVPNRAVGYMRGRGPRRPESGPLVSNRPDQPARGSAAGGGYSTAEDLSRYLAALRAGKILAPATAEKFFGAKPQPDGTIKVGFGIAGGSPGVNGVLLANGDWTIIVLANLDPPTAESLAREAGALTKRVAGGGESGAMIREVKK